MTTMPQLDRERVRRTLTFWLRPAFLLRAVNRFQRVAGFDRAVALASSALTALIPLAIVVGSVLPAVGGKSAAQRIIDRYDLTGGGAEAVRDALSPAAGTETDVTVVGALLIVVAVLSFTRGVQRLFEQTWELKPLSVRNTFNGLLRIAGLTAYLTVSGWLHGVQDQSRLQIGASLVLIPVSVVFLVWSGWVLTAKRIEWRTLVPFGVVVRRRGSGPARGVLHGRRGLRAAPVQLRGASVPRVDQALRGRARSRPGGRAARQRRGGVRWCMRASAA